MAISRKKVLFVSNTSWYIFNFRLGAMKKFREKGFEVSFCAPRDGFAEDLKLQGFDYIPADIDRKGRNPLRDLKLLLDLFVIYAHKKPDMIFHFTPKVNIYGAIAAKIAGVKCINTVTGLGYVFMRKGFLLRLVKILYRISFRFPEKIFFQNNDDLGLFLRDKLVAADKTGIVKGSGVNVDLFLPYGHEDGQRQKSTFVFLVAGRVLWDKGIGEYVSAIETARRSHADIEGWILGKIDDDNPSGISRKVVEKWEEKLKIKYLGETRDVRPFIAQSDVVVCPSYREGMPRTLLEAMAMGKPIIATDTAGCRELIEDGRNGFIVAVKDADDLACAMVRIRELSPEKRKEMGCRSREKVVREFDENFVTGEYLKAVREALKA